MLVSLWFDDYGRNPGEVKPCSLRVIAVCLAKVLEIVIRRTIHLRDTDILISLPYEYLTLPGKRDFTGVTPWRMLRWGDYFGKAQITPGVLLKERGRQEREKELDKGSRVCNDAGPGAQACWRPVRSLKRQWNRGFLRAPRRNTALMTPSC